MTEFKFTDYSSDSELNEVLIRMFPVGTDKSAVDRILVDQAGARIEEYNRRDASLEEETDKRYYYIHRGLRSEVFEALSFVPEGEFSWKVTVVFSKDDKLKRIKVI